MNPLGIDINEPPYVVDALKKSCEVITGAFNIWGQADYNWVDAQGKRRQTERKQTGELLSDMDGVEAQLNRELQTCDELTLLIEGVWLPTPDGIQTYVLGDAGKYWRMGHRFRHQPYLTAKFESWKWSLRHVVGIEVVETPHIDATIATIAAAYKQSQVPPNEHTTMRRYVREHIPPMDVNPHVDNLLRLKGCNIGPVTAQKLVAWFGTFSAVVCAGQEELAGIMGAKDAETFLKRIGRTI